MNNKSYTLLGIPGSLSLQSSNMYILQHVGKYFAGTNTNFTIFNDIGSLPHFNPSLDTEPAPEAVANWRQQLAAADAVLICSPEYAFGVPGSLKNALDWTVSSDSFGRKPVGIITASTRGDKAHASLQLIFTALGAVITDETNLLIQYVRMKVDDKGMVTDTDTEHLLHQLMNHLKEAMEAKGNGQDV
jgi:chromate reductase, NAD(P)H dehydrogenase (quinone)